MMRFPTEVPVHDWHDVFENVYSIVSKGDNIPIVMMLFTFNIGNGLTAGLVLYPILKIAAGRWNELHPGAIVLAVVCALYYAFGIPH